MIRREKLETTIASNAKSIEIEKSRQEYLMRKVFDNNEELKDLEQKLKQAQCNKLRKSQLEERQELETKKMLQDFENDQAYLDKLEEANQKNQMIEHKKKIQMLENERDVRRQIIKNETDEENAQLEQKLKDKAQVDAIVVNILNQNYNNKQKVEESKKYQFGNMVESLYLKKKLIKDQLEADQKDYK